MDRNYPQEAAYPTRIVAIANEMYDLDQQSRKMRSSRSHITSSHLPKVKAKEDKDILSQDHDDTMKEQGAHIEELKSIKAKLSKIDSYMSALEKERDALAIQLPNLTHEDTPLGGKPKVISYINSHLVPDHLKQGLANAQEKVTADQPSGVQHKSHVDIGTELELLDFTSSTMTSGWGWYFLLNEAVLLEQALIQYALHTARAEGWTLVTPPSIVYSHIASACGFRPRDHNGDQQIYSLKNTSSNGSSSSSKDKSEPNEPKADLSLTGTAEIPLAGMLANSTLPISSFPRKTIGVSRCYRAEAGARGAATKGLYRVHEFTKVELFAWCLPDPYISEKIYDEMIALQTKILTALGLPCRVLNMPTEDLGASAYRKVDIEAYMPSRANVGDSQGWGEVTSVSECTSYQARRLNARYRAPSGKLTHLWSLNGTALAVPRVLLALLEHGWDEKEKMVRVPKVLWRWMDGVEAIKKRK